MIASSGSERRPLAGIAATGRETHASAGVHGAIPTGNGRAPPEKSRT